MARKVYTYESITELDKHPHFDEICDAPHITATSNLSYAISDCYGEQISNVIDIHRLQKAIISDWGESSSVFEQFMDLGTIIRGMQNLSSSEKQVRDAFLKNRSDVLSTMRTLIEADIFPEDIDGNSAEEKLFQAIWTRMETYDLTIGKFRARMDKYFSDPDAFQKAISQFNSCMNSDTIVLHGFYYITALQERIFDLLELSGKTLIFLGNIRHDADGANQIWATTFSPENGFPDQKDWTRDLASDNPPAEFGKLFTGGSSFTALNNIRIIRYKNEAEFVSDVKRITEYGYGLYTTDRKKAETVLKEIYPEKFKNRHLLSYPVGRYFYVLHSLWDRNTQTINLTPDNIQICLASGWVIKNHKNGRDFSHAFELIKPYCTDCVTLQDWEHRIALLKKYSDVFSGIFEKHIPSQPEDNSRYHKIMANPFLNLSCFSVGTDEVGTVFEMINVIIETARNLFGSGSEIYICDHFETIQKILNDGANEAAVFDEERAIIKELSDRLANPNISIKKCLPDDISEAVMLIIGGGILDEDTFEFDASSDETFVRNLALIETAPIIAKGKIHLCMCDESRLPGGVKRFGWPLNESIIHQLQNRINGRRKQYVKDYMSVTLDSVLANRYLFFNAICNDDIELSWIAEENGKSISESPYVRLLQEIFECKISAESVPNAVPDVHTLSVPACPEMTVSHECLRVREMEYDALLCPWKYIYGYLSSEQPSYRTEFHYNFVLSSIIGAFSKATGLSADTVSDNVLECFPYLSAVEKRQIRDYISLSLPDSFSDSLDDVSYSPYRIMPHFLSKDLIANAGQKAEENNGQDMHFNLFNVQSTGYQTCLYCQFKDDCVHAIRERNDD